jgi:hypothetical protein
MAARNIALWARAGRATSRLKVLTELIEGADCGRWPSPEDFPIKVLALANACPGKRLEAGWASN